MKKVNIVLIILISLLLSSCNDEPTNTEVIGNHFGIETPLGVDEIVRTDEFIIYLLKYDDESFELDLEYEVNDVYFEYNVKGTQTFLNIGYFGEVGEIYYTIEEMLEMNLFNEIYLAEHIPINGSNHLISEISSLNDYSGGEGIRFVYVYDEDSIYHQSMIEIIYNFSLDSEFMVYTTENNSIDDLVRPMIPILKVYDGEQLLYTYIGNEIISLISMVVTIQRDFENPENELLNIYSLTEYNCRIGKIEEYDIVFDPQGPTMFAPMQFLYEGIYFWNNVMHGDGNGDLFSAMGIYAVKDGYIYELEDLFENDLIEMEDLLRIMPYYNENPKF